MCAPYKYKVFTVQHPDAPVPFAGPRFTREAPVGYDVLCRQRVSSLASYRPLYQAVLDAELCLMGEMAMVTEPGSTDTGDAAVVVTQAAVPTVSSTAQPQAAQEKVRTSYYVAFVIALGVIAASYTIIGGLKAVVYTDVIQSVLILFGGIAVALLTFSELGGWGRMMMLDAAAGTNAKLKLYEPMNHPDLPWTGVLTGLMFMHCYYWGTNQFIVQRALGARTGGEARLGIIVAGFLIPIPSPISF